MNITIKNLKHSAFASHETECFECAIYVDGKKIGFAENDGRGGSTNIQPAAAWTMLNDYAKTLPPVVCDDLTDPTDRTKPFTYRKGADSLIDDLVFKALAEKRLKAACRKRILFTVTDQPGIFQTRPLTPALMAMTLGNGLPAFRNANKVQDVLNTLPPEQALTIYMNHD